MWIERSVFAIAALLLLTVGGRLAHLEVAKGATLRAQAEQQQTIRNKITAQRGEILDSRGRVLAGTKRLASVFVDCVMIEDIPYAAASIAPTLGLQAKDVEKLIRERPSDRHVWVKRGMSEEDLHEFQEVRRQRNLGAFGIEYEFERLYPYGRTAAQVLGFVGTDGGGAGVEQEYEKQLRGHDGFRQATVDVRRRRLASSPEDYQPPKDGASVVLTIDVYLQQRVEERLKAAVEQFKAQWGAAVLMDPNTGEVLAMASYPDFDPAQPIPVGAKGAELDRARELTRNRAIADAYEPGSIFKPFIAAPAFDAGLARLDEVFAINGPARDFGGRIINDTHPYGTLTLHEVISKSSNIGMAMLGSRLGNTRLHQFVREFGFGDRTGVNLPGEHTGLVQDFSRWGPFSTNSIPIGQEIGVTPIQIVTAFSALCNGGTLMRPRVVRGVVATDGAVEYDNSRPIALRRILGEEATREFRLRALVETVKSGTGTKAANAFYQVFGKTGTAQIARAAHTGRGYIDHAYVGSFVGGAPASNPQAAVIVSLYRPSSGQYYGGTVSAPAAGEILGDALQYMRVPSDIDADVASR